MYLYSEIYTAIKDLYFYIFIYKLVFVILFGLLSINDYCE